METLEIRIDQLGSLFMLKTRFADEHRVHIVQRGLLGPTLGKVSVRWESLVWVFIIDRLSDLKKNLNFGRN